MVTQCALVRQGHPRRSWRRKRADDIICYRVEVLVAPVALGCHLGGETGVVLGYLGKAKARHA
jgi:hypothetical protein